MNINFTGKTDIEITTLLAQNIAKADDVITEKIKNRSRFVILSAELSTYALDIHGFEPAVEKKPFNCNEANKFVEIIGMVGDIEVYMDPRLPAELYYMSGRTWRAIGLDVRTGWLFGDFRDPGSEPYCKSGD